MYSYSQHGPVRRNRLEDFYPLLNRSTRLRGANNGEMMMKKILIMGLPGAGKTTLAEAVCKLLRGNSFRAAWFNADAVRKQFDDWDFSAEGRLRQAQRMKMLAEGLDDRVDFAVCDFVAPTEELRAEFNADLVVWVDTITEGRFADTNKAFIPPIHYDIRVTEQDSDKWALIVAGKCVALLT